MDNCILLYIFGDRYGVENLRLDTSKEVVRLPLKYNNDFLPSPYAVREAFSSLSEDSPMCQLIIDINYRHGDPELSDNLPDYDCVPFWQGLWRKYAKVSMHAATSEDVTVFDKHLELCDYHEHASKEEKAECKKS